MGFLKNPNSTNKQYLHVSRITSDQSSVGTNVDLIYNSKLSGNIPFNTTTGVGTLTAGKTYKITVSNSFQTFSNTTGGYVSYAIVDAADNTVLSPVTETLPPTNTSSNISGILEFIYSPTENKNIKVRTQACDGTCKLRYAVYSGMTIIQI